jgi:hypothetical protein
MQGVMPFPKQDKLRILLDSASIENSPTSPATEKLVTYKDSSLFSFLLSDASHAISSDLEAIQVIKDESDNITSIRAPSSTGYSLIRFPFSQNTLAERSDIFDNLPPSSDDIRRATLCSVLEILTRQEEVDMMVTTDAPILDNRAWFQTANKCSIVTVEEALEIVDIFAKRKGAYFLSSQKDVGSSWYWYWCSFRSKIPYYNVTLGNLDALASRFTRVLMALDEMTVHYYSGANNDTMEYTMYHFVYLLALICGIFDTLAIETRGRLSISFSGDNIPSRTSLNKKAGDKFLKALKEASPPGPDLWSHIDNYQNFIRIIYELRELDNK